MESSLRNANSGDERLQLDNQQGLDRYLEQMGSGSLYPHFLGSF